MNIRTTTIKCCTILSLDVRPGEKLALVGPSGGGKTTLCNLIPRFYDATSGHVRIDGRDVKTVTLESLRRAIGIVQQDVYLFSGTVYENIALRASGRHPRRGRAGRELAGAHEFISALHSGYDTYVGERGVKLSGGQKQRISIARVFLKNPPILILDEATSALDNESEHLVGQSLARLAQGRTTLTIAHRLTTIQHADRILVLGENGIEEEGTHEELLAKHGVCRKLWTGAAALNKPMMQISVFFSAHPHRNSKGGTLERPLVSIVIPVYNAAPGLARCIESVRKQTYETSRYSSSTTAARTLPAHICHMYERIDPRVHVIDKENAGVSAARNTGSRAARGKYIQFVDSDDYLAPGATATLIEQAEHAAVRTW